VCEGLNKKDKGIRAPL